MKSNKSSFFNKEADLIMKKRWQPPSLRTLLLIAFLLCWVLPVLCLMILQGTMLKRSYERSARQELTSRAANAVEQTEIRMDDLFEASKTVSYDGVVRNAYRLYQRDGDSAALYRTVTDYLNQNFTWNERIPAAFISFWEEPDVKPYAASRGDFGYNTQREYRETIEPDVLRKMSSIDTKILLLEYNGELYIARNLLDSRFQPYATVVLLSDKELLFQSLEPVRQISETSMWIDGSILLDQEGNLYTMENQGITDEGSLHEQENPAATAQGNLHEQEYQAATADADPPSDSSHLRFAGETSGHSFVLHASIAPFHFWKDIPQIQTAVIFVLLLVLPLLLIAVYLFHRHVTQPIETLVEAYNRLECGDREYKIQKRAVNREFGTLYENFNQMSGELKNQFDRSILEQQALQEARVKALQLQINPHFLNNTLEIINWEARLANDDRVSAMIEALSVMMDGALGRDGRSQIHLREELTYVDAYLYIIHERLGNRLQIDKAIDDSILDLMVPRLILQPLVENAVEHDLAPGHGGNLCIRARCEEVRIILEVEHDGSMTAKDLASIEEMLSSPLEDTKISGQVGLRNVRQRLTLIYGEEGELTLREIAPNRILARVSFPVS